MAGGGGSGVYFDPGGEGGVIDGGNAVREARSIFGDRGRWGVRGVKSGCNGRKQSACRSCFWKEVGQDLVQYGGSCRGCHGRADLVGTIVRGRDASGEGWRGGVVKLAADLHEDVAQMVESSPLLRSEGLSVSNPEADTPDEIVRAGFGEKLVSGFQ